MDTLIDLQNRRAYLDAPRRSLVDGEMVKLPTASPRIDKHQV